MAGSNAVPIALEQNRSWIWLGALLCVLGYFGHFFAARAIGGSASAYGHHTFGFFLILVVTGSIIAALGHFFWKGRRDITILSFAGCSALADPIVRVLGPGPSARHPIAGREDRLLLVKTEGAWRFVKLVGGGSIT